MAWQKEKQLPLPHFVFSVIVVQPQLVAAG